MTAAFTIALVALAGPALLWLGAWSRRGSHATVTTQLRYQAVAVPFAVGVCLLVRLLVPDHGAVSLVGDLAAPVRQLGWMGVGDADQWGTLLLTTGSIIVFVTAVVVWLQSGRRSSIGPADVARAIPWAAAIAVLNATNEELIFRVALIEGLSPSLGTGMLTATVVALISGLLFGLPHWFGHPGGPLGALLAGFLGWLAATATIQTGGIAWAWSLHVVLDVVILSVVLAASGVARAVRVPSVEVAS
jgi:hypothetical protein